MAMRYAAVAGNWSNPATWNGGTLPGAGDDVYANNKIITVDQDITVRSLNWLAVSPAVAGGTFVTTGTRVINLYELRAGNATPPGGSPGRLLDITGGTATVNIATTLSGDINQSSIPGYALYVGAGSTVVLNVPSIVGGLKDYTPTIVSNGAFVSLTVNGNIVGGNGDGTRGIDFSGTDGTLIINGNVTGGTWIDSVGVRIINTRGQCTIHGDITGGNDENAFGVFVWYGSLRIDGTMRWGVGACAPVSGGDEGRIMFMRDGDVALVAASDDDWPANTGAPITLGRVNFPTAGIVWPPSVLSPTA